jgi:uroporphyrinogen-III decarboxylase
MNDTQWQTLLAVIRGERLEPLPTGFIVDSPWLPHWAGYPMLDYFVSEQVWLEANVAALQAFPETLLLPGFWSEYGMCTEPSAFGAVSVWQENEFPFAKKVLRSAEEVDSLERPDPRKDGLLPWVVKRLKRLQPEIERAGHKVRFAVARGPLNIASFLLGTTEFLMALRTEPERMHRLVGMLTDFLLDWLAWQRECFPSIDGILVLDDLVGLIGPQDFQEFALPHLRRIFAADVTVKFFHNDAPCKVCAPHLAEIGVNLLNFGFQPSLAEMKAWTGGSITLLGNLPPRDVLAQGTPEEVARRVAAMLGAAPDLSHLIVSCGGGMPPGAPTANIRALIRSVAELTR